MSESLDRINAEVKKHGLSAKEADLLANYYGVLIGVNAALHQTILFKIVSAARKIASMWADLPSSIQRVVPHTVHTPICCAARVMYYVAELLQDTDDRAHWYREASIAYLQSGNMPGAYSAWQQYEQLKPPSDSSDWILCALFGIESKVSSSVREVTPQCLTEPWLAADPGLCRDAQDSLYLLSCNPRFSSVFDKSLSYRIGQTLPLLGAMSLDVSLTAGAQVLPAWYRDALIRTRRMLLMPSQVAAIQSWFRAKRNFVLCTPTSTGKTFVAELALVLALQGDDGIGVLVTPYRAVARTICKTLRDRLSGSHIEVIEAYGDGAIASSAGNAIIVGTPEKIDGLVVNSPRILQRISVLVLDEVHLITQRVRGAFYESFIARMLMEQAIAGTPSRILAISAVVQNHEVLAKWLKADAVVTSEWRPNPIVEAYWSEEDKLFLHDATSPVGDPSFWAFENFAPEMPNWPSSFVPQKGMQNALKIPLGRRCSWYSRTWNKRTGGAVLVICSSRAQTREFATIAGNEVAEIRDDRLNAAATRIDKEFPYLSLLTYCLRRGIAYHNAALPSAVRNQIEDLLESRRLRVVFATTTLAEGADFPFRAVVIAATAHFDAESAGYSAMSPLLLRNIAGRGGRTSGQLIGDVVQMYSPHTMADADGVHINSQRIFLNYLIDPRNCEVSSGLAAGLNAPHANQTISTVFSAFDRVIARWENRDNAVSEYRTMFFAPTIRNQEGTGLEVEYENIMRAGRGFGEALALRASPLRLTSLGRTILRSNFAVSSAEVIWKTIEERGWFSATATPIEIVEACSMLGGRIPEVTELRDTNRRPLKEQNLGEVFSALSGGASMRDVYLLAEESASSATRKLAKKLVAGNASTDDPVHARFEVFADELKRKLLFEIPSVANAMKLYIEYRSPRVDISSFEQVLAVSAKLSNVID